MKTLYLLMNPALLLDTVIVLYSAVLANQTVYGWSPSKLESREEKEHK